MDSNAINHSVDGILQIANMLESIAELVTKEPTELRQTLAEYQLSIDIKQEDVSKTRQRLIIEEQDLLRLQERQAIIGTVLTIADGDGKSHDHRLSQLRGDLYKALKIFTASTGS